MATDNKYDRQLRLWGSNGQRALMESHILLVGGDSAGTETLKNLVLPGVGHFTILDEHLLSEADLGSNFFVHASGLGKPRGEVIAELLCELNSDVRGRAIFGNLSSAIAADSNFLSQFNLVVASNMPEAHFLQLSEACWQRNIALLVVRAYGLLGCVRIQTKCHDIVESKPDGQTAPIVWDLRIADPFPELLEFCQQVDFAKLDWTTHMHVPYVVILVSLLAQWRAANNGSVPSTKTEKEAFVEGIKLLTNSTVPADYASYMQAQAAEGKEAKAWPGILEANNFQEAVKEAYRAYQVVQLPGELQDLLEQELGSSSSSTPSPGGDTGVLLRSLHAFMLRSGNRVPLSGQIPDMFSNTDLFIALQQLYQNKAAADRALFSSLLAEQLAAVGRNGDAISQETVDLFCRNIFNLRRVSTRSLAQEHAEPERDGLLMALEDAKESTSPEPVQAPILWYLALRAADRFYSNQGRWPGAASDDPAVLSEETELVWGECQKLVAELGVAEQTADLLTRDHAVEIVRYGAADVHNVGAVLGGIAAQEAVKLITHQYIPINNTYFFNGIVCAGKVYEL